MPAAIDTAPSEAIVEGVQTTQAKTLGGSVAAMAATPPGALGVTLGHNAGTAAVGSFTTESPEIGAYSWLVTLLYQGIKHNKHVNQDRHKWFILLGLALVIGFGIYMLKYHGDWMAAGSQALMNAGLSVIDAIANYHTTKPLGYFSSAEEMPA